MDIITRTKKNYQDMGLLCGLALQIRETMGELRDAGLVLVAVNITSKGVIIEFADGDQTNMLPGDITDARVDTTGEIPWRYITVHNDIIGCGPIKKGE